MELRSLQKAQRMLAVSRRLSAVQTHNSSAEAAQASPCKLFTNLTALNTNQPCNSTNHQQPKKKKKTVLGKELSLMATVGLAGDFDFAGRLWILRKSPQSPRGPPSLLIFAFAEDVCKCRHISSRPLQPRTRTQVSTHARLFTRPSCDLWCDPV